MHSQTEIPVRTKQERWRWLGYVGFALLGALLTFAGARAQQRASEQATFQKLINDYCSSWSSGSAENPAHLYAKDSGLVFYDVTPFAYRGWGEYREGVKKAFFNDNFESGKLTAGNDLKVTRRGTVAWTTVSMHLSVKNKDGKNLESDLRYTGIWERRGNAWVIVHEHLSAPLS